MLAAFFSIVFIVFYFTNCVCRLNLNVKLTDAGRVVKTLSGQRHIRYGTFETSEISSESVAFPLPLKCSAKAAFKCPRRP